MRRILVDHARERHAHNATESKPLDNAETISVELNESLVDLDDALNELAKQDELQAKNRNAIFWWF